MLRLLILVFFAVSFFSHDNLFAHKTVSKTKKRKSIVYQKGKRKKLRSAWVLGSKKDVDNMTYFLNYLKAAARYAYDQ